MVLFCTEEFKVEVGKLRKNNSYASIERVLAESYCDATFEQACEGDILSLIPGGLRYVKKRLQGGGGFRVYVLAVVVGEKVYLGFVHPKTGSYGRDNVEPEHKKAILRQILTAIQCNTLYLVTRDEEKAGKIKFLTYVAV